MAEKASRDDQDKAFSLAVSTRLRCIQRVRTTVKTRIGTASDRAKEVAQQLSKLGEKESGKRHKLQAEAWRLAMWKRDLKAFLKTVEEDAFDTVRDAAQGVLYPESPDWVEYAVVIPVLAD